MKSLKNILLEKLDIHNFPDNLYKLEDVIEFLENNGFKHVEAIGNKDFDELLELKKSKCYTTEDNRIWFADTSKEISRKNPWFMIEFNRSNHYYNVWYWNEKEGSETIVSGDSIFHRDNFLKELKKCFK